MVVSRGTGAATGYPRRGKRCKVVHALLEAVYLDSRRGPVVAVEPRADFAPLFEMVVRKLDGDGPVILKPGEVLA